MNAARPFVWLHVRRLSRTAIYWLRSLGIIDDTREGALGAAYTAYAIAIFAGALAVAWGALLSVALRLGTAVPASVRSLMMRGVVAPGFHWIIAIVIGMGLLGPLWQVAAPDLTYGTISPQRTAPLLLSYLPKLLVVVILSLPVGGFVFVALTNSLEHYGAALVVVSSATAVAYTAAWAVSVLRFSTDRWSLRALLWLVPPVVIVAGSFTGSLPVDPGRMLIDAQLRGLTEGQVLWLALCFALALVALLIAGERVSMTLLADASTRRSERQALASLSRFDPSLAAQLRRQAAFRSRRVHGRLPTSGVQGTLLGRVVLGRFRDRASIWGLIRAISILVTGCVIMVNPQGFLWLWWFIALVRIPPNTLIMEFEQDMHPFMKQFLPQRRIDILIMDALLPAAAIVVVGIPVVLLFHIGADPALTAVLLVTLVVLSTLTQALRSGVSSLSHYPIADIIATVVAFGIVLVFARVGLEEAIAAAVSLSLVLFAIIGQADGAERSDIPPSNSSSRDPQDDIA